MKGKAFRMKKLIYFVISVLLFIAGKFLLQSDYISFLQWWAVIAGLGLSFLPFTYVLFHNFHDKGYLFSKVFGIAIASYLMWLSSSIRLMKFTRLSCILCVVVGLLFNAVLFFWLQKKIRKSDMLKERMQGSFGLPGSLWRNSTLDAIWLEEILFFAAFLLFTYIRCFKPEAYGTEKFMDYGFMTSMMRSEFMPPQDFWFSGTKLNYYYVGQYIAVYLTKLSFVKVTDAYNLMLMMVGAFALVLPYSLGYNVTLQFLKSREKNNKIIPVLSGILSGTGVCIAGNMHYPVFRWLEPAARKFFGIEANDKKYWFPDATRYIGYFPETNDKTIHEFPAYSFVLGDLHAHVINIMLVLTVLGILFAWLIGRERRKEDNIPVWKEIFHPAIITISFMIGLFHMTNFWDFPIYYVVSGAIILFSNLSVYNFKGKALWLTALQGAAVIAISEVVCIPFTFHFDQIATNIRLVDLRTPLNQLFILWGLPIYTVICFVLALITNYRTAAAASEEEKDKPAVINFLYTMPASDLFIMVLGLCSIGLVLLPELIYVQDIYSGEYKRANTMFKLTYQAFIMFGLCFGYILLRLLCYGRTKTQRKHAFAGLLLFLFSLTYVQNAVQSWYGNIFNIADKSGLDATAFMETTMPEDALATDWLNEHIIGMPVVLEANGDSYTDYERVSVITGLPTVLGWHTHEWLWKSSSEIVDARAADIETIYTSLRKVGEEETYTSLNKEELLQLLKKYDVSYIYVGKLEQEKYSDINHEMLKSLGDVVFDILPGNGRAYETYIVKVGVE